MLRLLISDYQVVGMQFRASMVLFSGDKDTNTVSHRHYTFV